jgi:hypothetical protein
VVDVPAKLAARVRLLSTGHGRKNDNADATSVGVAALTATGLHTVVIDEAVLALRALVEHVTTSSPPARRPSTGSTGCSLAAITEHNGTAMLRSLTGMISVFVFYLITALAVPGALGAADIRLAGLLGLVLGWPGWTTVIGGAMLGLLYGSLMGAILIALRRATYHPHSLRPSLDRGSLHRPTSLLHRELARETVAADVIVCVTPQPWRPAAGLFDHAIK